MKGNTVEDAGARGITVSGGDVEVTGNSILRPADVGIYSSSAKTTVVGNSIGRAGSSGLRLDKLEGAEICDNEIFGSLGDGMLVSSSKNLVVSGNELQSSGGCGMLFSYCSDCDISQNLIDGAASEGIYYQYSTGGVISSNEVVKTGGFAICVAGSTSSATVESNVATALSGHDIRIGDGAIGCTVTGNMCGGGGVGIVSSVLASTTYEPADCRVCATVDSPDNYLIEWVPAKIALGTGSYIVEWTHSSDDFDGCSSTIVDGVTCDNVLINDPAGVSHVRVRAVNTISGIRYISSGSSGYVAQVGKVCYELIPAGGTGGDRTATGTIGAALPQIAVPSRPGYDFGGYWTGRDGTGTQVYSSDGKGVSVCAKDYSTVVLYASWSLAREVTVTFSAPGSHPETRVVVIRAGTLFSSLAPQDPVRTGYDFAGWCTKDGSAVSDDYAVPGDIDELEFSAAWNVRKYHISFSANGGEGGTTTLLEFGSGIKPPEVSRTGYDLMGWSPSLPETVPAEDATFCAQWRVHEYKVTFDAAGGIEDTVLYLGYGSAIAAPTVTRAGHTFNGWSPAVPAAVPAEDTEYVAQWKVNKYKVTFDAAGGAGGYSSQMDYGTPITPPEVSRTGYDFMGWEPLVDATVPASDMTYVAQWKKTSGPEPIPDPDPTPDPVPTPDPDPTPDPGPTPAPDPDPEPTPEPGEAHELYEAAAGAAPAVASEYNGYLYDGDSGEMKGAIQVKVGKPGKKDGMASVKAAVVLGAKKVTLKAKGNGKAVINRNGPTEIDLVGGEACTVVLGDDGVSGTYGAYFIDGARNFFASKTKAEQAAANAVLGKWQGPVNVVWGGGSVNVAIAKKGKAKVKGTLASGAKVSANAVFLVGEEWCAVPVAAPKANLAFTLWLSRDGSTAIVEGLGDDAKAGKPGVLGKDAAFHVSKAAALWSSISGTLLTDYIPDGVEVPSKGGKWALPKAGKVVYKNGSVDESKLGKNPSGLKLTYKAKDGSFKGSFKVYAVNGGKAKATTVSVTGVMVKGVGRGTATIKGKGGITVTIE